MQVFYNPQMRSNLKVNFPGVEHIPYGHSNLCQDMFVLSVLNGKTQGYYLEVGGELPVAGNNTYLMERYFGWQGVSIELDPKYTDSWQQQRTNRYICTDALTVDYQQLLDQMNYPKVIDYFSCDIEPPEQTFQALKAVLSTDRQFRVITFEHDHYNGGGVVRSESRQFMAELGYQLIVGDVSHAGNSVEDWWVNPKLVDSAVIKQLYLSQTWNADQAIFHRPEEIRPLNRNPFAG